MGHQVQRLVPDSSKLVLISMGSTRKFREHKALWPITLQRMDRVELFHNWLEAIMFRLLKLQIKFFTHSWNSKNGFNRRAQRLIWVLKLTTLAKLSWMDLLTKVPKSKEKWLKRVEKSTFRDTNTLNQTIRSTTAIVKADPQSLLASLEWLAPSNKLISSTYRTSLSRNHRTLR